MSPWSPVSVRYEFLWFKVAYSSGPLVGFSTNLHQTTKTEVPAVGVYLGYFWYLVKAPDKEN